MKKAALCFATSIFLLLAEGQTFAQATVTTDKSDYPPGSTVQISGSGFAAGETVQLQVLNLTDPSDTGSEHQPWTVAADASGNITATWFVTDDELGMTLQLTATGLTSGLTAQATFTDGNASDGTGTLTVSPSTVNAGTTNTMVFTFATDSGKDYLADSLATIVIPAGWTAPQTNSIGSAGYVKVVANTVNGNNPTPAVASITNISGSGPWTIFIDFTAAKNGNGWTFTYSNAVAPSTPSTNVFAIQTRNNAGSGGVLTSLVSGSPTYIITLGPPNQLGFTTAAQTLTAGVNSGTITVQIQDAGGNPTNATANRVVNLSSTSGSGIFKTIAGATISSITILAGQNSTNLLYNDTLAGTPTITASTTSPTTLASATQVETVKAAAATQLVITSAVVTVTAGVQSGEITVQSQDQFGNPSTNASPVTVNLTSSSAGATFYSTNGTTAITSTNIVANRTTARFLYVDTVVGTPTITNKATGLTSATQVETITKATPSITGVTASQSIVYGTTSIKLGGTISATGGTSPVYPANGETVSASINGHSVNGTVTNSTGGFFINYNDASLATDGVGSSPYIITYAYAGDANLNAAGNNTSTSLTVTKTTPVLTLSTTAITYGQTLSSSSLSGSSAQNANNSASVAGTFAFTNSAIVPKAGTTNVGVAFTPTDAANYNSVTNIVTVTVNKASTSVSVTSSSNPSGFLQSINFTATLPTDAVGSITFKTNSVLYDTKSLSSGSATSVSTTSLPRGANTVTAEYTGDGNYFGSTNSITQTVTNHPPVATDFPITRTAGTRLLIAKSSLTNHWSDVDGDTVTLLYVTLTSSNGAAIVTNSSFIQCPSNAPNMNDFIFYTIGDGHGGTNTGQIVVTVNPFVVGQTNSITGGPSSVTVQFYGLPGYTYTVQRATNSPSGPWTDRTNILDNTGPFTYTETSPPNPAYYRLKWQP